MLSFDKMYCILYPAELSFISHHLMCLALRIAGYDDYTSLISLYLFNC